MAEPKVDDPAALPGGEGGGPVADSQRIADLEAQLKNKEDLLKKHGGESQALGDARQEIDRLKNELATAKNPPTTNAADPRDEALRAYWSDVYAQAAKNVPWAVAEVARLEDQQRRDLLTAWNQAIATVPAEIRDEVEKVAREQQIHPKVAQEMVQARRDLAAKDARLKELEEKAKDAPGDPRPSTSPGAPNAAAVDMADTMKISVWRTEVAKVKARYDANPEDQSARKELNRLTAIRDTGRLILDQ